MAVKEHRSKTTSCYAKRSPRLHCDVLVGGGVAQSVTELAEPTGLPPKLSLLLRCLRLPPEPQIDAGADDVGGVVDVDEGGRQEAVLGVQRYAVGAEVALMSPGQVGVPLLCRLEIRRVNRHHLDRRSGRRRHEDHRGHTMVGGERQPLDEFFLRHHPIVPGREARRSTPFSQKG